MNNLSGGVEEPNFHLTLKFLGDVNLPVLEKIETGLEKVSLKHNKSELLIRDLGAFPSLKKPRVIWAGIYDSENCLSGLWADTEQEMVRLGFQAEPRKFSPHLTMGRVKDTKPVWGLNKIVDSLTMDEFAVPVTEIRLMRSRLLPSGPEYSCINSFGLQEHS